MRPNLLILGGTTEAAALARAVGEAGLAATLSLAGRVETPAPQPLPVRVGGFGGVTGLADYLGRHEITHLIDATHPFAAEMSTNAIAAARQAGVPLIALSRPPWTPGPDDRWQAVPDIPAAVRALAGLPRRVFLAIGRMNLAAFADMPQHHYLLRLVDPQKGHLPLPSCDVVVSRGPFTEAADRALLEAHQIELVVCKNSGGTGAVAKLAAARALGLPVVMIDRPVVPQRDEAATVAEVIDWIAHAGAPRGV